MRISQTTVPARRHVLTMPRIFWPYPNQAVTWFLKLTNQISRINLMDRIAFKNFSCKRIKGHLAVHCETFFLFQNQRQSRIPLLISIHLKQQLKLRTSNREYVCWLKCIYTTFSTTFSWIFFFLFDFKNEVQIRCNHPFNWVTIKTASEVPFICCLKVRIIRVDWIDTGQKKKKKRWLLFTFEAIHWRFY